MKQSLIILFLCFLSFIVYGQRDTAFQINLDSSFNKIAVINPQDSLFKNKTTLPVLAAAPTPQPKKPNYSTAALLIFKTVGK